VGSSRINCLAGHKFCQLSFKFVANGLAQAVQLSWQSHGRAPHLAATGGQHHESGSGLPASWQLRAADLAVEAAKTVGADRARLRPKRCMNLLPYSDSALINAFCVVLDTALSDRQLVVRNKQRNQKMEQTKMKKIVKSLMLTGLFFTFAGLNAKASVSCGPVTDPCNPTKTFTWTCSDGQTCGTAYCGSICAIAQSSNCYGNTGYVNVTVPFGTCNNPQG